jgi:hypothetical protein
MTGLSISKFDITSSVIMFREELWSLQNISTKEQVADILTKALNRGKFVFFKDKLGVVSNTFLGMREC